MNNVPLFPYNHCSSEAAYCLHTQKKIHFQDFAWKGILEMQSRLLPLGKQITILR